MAMLPARPLPSTPGPSGPQDRIESLNVQASGYVMQRSRARGQLPREPQRLGKLGGAPVPAGRWLRDSRRRWGGSPMAATSVITRSILAVFPRGSTLLLAEESGSPKSPEKLPTIPAPGLVPASTNSRRPCSKGRKLSGVAAPGGMDQTPPESGSLPMVRVAPSASREMGNTRVISVREPSCSKLKADKAARSSTSGRMRRPSSPA